MTLHERSSSSLATTQQHRIEAEGRGQKEKTKERRKKKHRNGDEREEKIARAPSLLLLPSFLSSFFPVFLLSNLACLLLDLLPALRFSEEGNGAASTSRWLRRRQTKKHSGGGGGKKERYTRSYRANKDESQ